MKLQWFTVGTSLLLLSITVIWAAESYRKGQAEVQKRLAMSELSTMSAALDGQLTSSSVVLKALQAEILLRPQLTPERFELLASSLIDDSLPIRNIALAQDFVVQYVYPLNNNAAVLGFDYRNAPGQLKSVQQAIKTNEIVVSGPVSLVQGGRALIIRAAVRTHDDELWGVIAEVLDIDKLLQNVGFANHPDYRFALSSTPDDADSRYSIAGSEQLWQADSVTLSMAVPGYQWRLAALPRSGQWANRSLGYLLIVIGGVLVTLLIGIFMAWLVLTQNRLRRAMKVINHQAHYDVVTQLPNRSAFLEHLQSMVTRKPQFAVLFIDLDHFKEVNDNLGHAVGDELLAAVAQRLRDNLRGTDFIARLGGDEFVIVLHNTDTTDHVITVVKNLNQLLSEQFQLHQHSVQISASIGIALYPEDGGSADTLLKHADVAMYAAKTSGGKTYHFFNQQLRQQKEQFNHIADCLREALQQQQLSVHYQPIINLATQQVEQCEALVRWESGEETFTPAEFIPVAEKNGLIEAVGDTVFEQVCEDLLWFKQQHLDLTLTINRSERELQDLDKARDWINILQKRGIPTTQLIFEVTESLFMGDKTKQLDVIKYLRNQGIKIALDDFGTGYSSINYLQKHAVDILKIDRQFLHQTADDQVQVELLYALIRVAKALNMMTIAEGVETEQQWLLMEAAHCDYSQGYYISKPLPAKALVQFIKEWETRR